MTGKQLEQFRKEAKWGTIAYEEASCRSMINSCLCYGTRFLESRYKDDYIEKLGEARVLELYNEQKADFDKSVVKHNVYTDGEGCTYNSIKRRDE